MSLTKPLPGATISQHPINLGLVLWTLFNEGAGSRVADISGKRNHGTVTNVDLTASWGGSPQGGGFTLDGVNDFIVVAESPSLSPLTSMSVVAILNGPSQADDAFEYVLTQFDSGAAESAWAIRTTSSGGGGPAMEILLWDTGGTLQRLYRSSAGIDVFDGTWNQIGFTFDGGTEVLSLYGQGRIDTNPTRSTDNALTGLNDADTDIRFGTRGDLDRHWDGSLSDVKIYNRALTQLEMQQLQTNPYLGILD